MKTYEFRDIHGVCKVYNLYDKPLFQNFRKSLKIGRCNGIFLMHAECVIQIQNIEMYLSVLKSRFYRVVR